MNTYLLKLFEKYNVSEKNRYEVKQIYSVLSDDKKKKLLDRFEFLAIRLEVIEGEILIERELLLEQAAERIWTSIIEWREKENNKIKKQLRFLKEEI